MPTHPLLSNDELRLIDAFLDRYRRGYFPMADPRPDWDNPPPAPITRDPFTGQTRPADIRPLRWYFPRLRAVMPLHEDPIPSTRQPHGEPPPRFHVSRTLQRIIRQRPFILRTDFAFEHVIRACAEPSPQRPDSWIDDQIIHVYTLLHRAGFAHSVEAWIPVQNLDTHIPRSESRNNPKPRIVVNQYAEALVGGIYGVRLGGAFFAESMFSRPALAGSNASNVCLVSLVRALRQSGFSLLDVQILNDHTARFGGYEIAAPEFRKQLEAALNISATFQFHLPPIF